MTKGKNLNPADAYRKAQRKKELKKNKAERSKARDFAFVKKDTRDIQDEIEKLEGLADPASAEKNRLTELKAELNNIMVKKEEYVQEHPEQRKLVFRARRNINEANVNKEEPVVNQKRNVFNKHGLPRHPERSIYYDPVMNPYGVPPPGMPYMERPLRPDEVASDNEVDDDDVVMPEGPPPTNNNDDIIDTDDDIPMPEGPPPTNFTGEPPVPPSIPLSGALLLNPSLHSVQDPSLFPPPLQTILLSHSNQHLGHAPPPGSHGASSYPPASAFMQPHMHPPPPPPGFFPRIQSASSMQDPLSSVPHQTYQAHRVDRLTHHPSLPPKPASAFPTGNAICTTAATVSAEPQLRDLKKEATAFVPTSLKRKKPVAGMSSKVNAAPCIGGETDTSKSAPTSRPDLVRSLKDRFGPVPVTAAPSNGNGPAKGIQPNAGKKDDYQKFVEEMGDVLGTQKL